MKKATVDITTKRGREALLPAHNPYYQKIAKGLAVGLYKPDTGAESWSARYRHKGKYRTSVLAGVQTYADAVAASLDYAESVREGEAPTHQEKRLTAKGSALTVRELIEQYLDQPAMKAEKGDRYKAWRYDAMRLSKMYVFPHLGDRSVGSLGSGDLTDLQTTLRETISPESVNRAMVCLRASLGYAQRKKYLLEPWWKEVKRLPENPAKHKARRKRYFSAVDRERFIDAVQPWVEPTLRALYYTGARPAEIHRLKVSDVYLDEHLPQPHVELVRYKGKVPDPRDFPLKGKVLEFFREHVAGREPDEILFPSKNGSHYSERNFNARIKAAKAKSDMPEFDAYSCRHAFIQDLINQGVPATAVARLTGTSLEHIMKHYSAGMDLASYLPDD